MKGVFLLFSIFAFTALALTPEEEAEFRRKVRGMSKHERRVSISKNLGSLVVSCPVGAVATTLEALLDTLPVASLINDFFVMPMAGDLERVKKLAKIKRMGNRELRADQYGTVNFLGGALSAVLDIFVTAYDYSDGNIDDKEDEESYIVPFQYSAQSYMATKITAKSAFGESGYCVDKFERLMILSGR